jgi:hypothetical protein
LIDRERSHQESTGAAVIGIRRLERQRVRCTRGREPTVQGCRGTVIAQLVEDSEDVPQ